VRETIGHILGKNAHGVLAGRRDGAVVNTLKVELAPELLGQLAAAGSRKSLLPFVMAEGRIDLPVVVGFMRTWAGGEAG